MAWNLKQKAQDHIVLILFGLITLLLLVVWRAIDSSVWDRVSAATPKRALWALLGLAGIAICLLGGALIDNKRKRKLETRKTLRFRIFGVHWDDQGNPLCPVCDCLMPIHHREMAGDVLWCPRCKTLFSLWGDNGDRLTLEQGKAGLEFFSPPPISN
jgi:hypothetical protein